MPLHVALVHDAQIPPPRYGGTERVVVWLARGLMELGHRVTLVARPGSGVPGAAPTLAYRDDWPARLPADVDVLHLHAPRGTGRPLPRPHVTTIHGNGQPGERFDPFSIFVSRRQAELHGSKHFVHNGVDVSEYRSEEIRSGRWAYLAKASWKVKNARGAVSVARAARVGLDLMGSRSFPLELQRLWPAWGGLRRWGMVDDATKREVLSRAEGLLFPVRWHEPFGLAVVEALASGCPVLATPYGSLPELVTPEVGLLSAQASDWVAAIRSGRFDAGAGSPTLRKACRARAAEHFSHRRMAENYVRYYEQVLQHGRLGEAGEAAPMTEAGFRATELLPWTE